MRNLLFVTTLLLGAGNVAAQVGDSRTWTPATLFPPGALLAVISGDPSRPGETTAELSLPDGYRVPRHLHPMGEWLEVREGTLLVGTGDTLRAGDRIFAPAGTPHYWVARGRTVIALTFEGPYTITYVNAHEAPGRASFPYRY